MGSSDNRARFGSYTSDGSSLRTIATLAFQPAAVTVQNTQDGSQLYWQEGMDEDSAIKTVSSGTRTLITSDGISVGSDVPGNPLPFGTFTIGVDAAIVVAGEVRWAVEE